LPFGYGLSYTTFKYGNLNVKPLPHSRYEVSFDLQNTGSRLELTSRKSTSADRRRQCRVRNKELKGLAKVDLRTGQTKRVAVVLESRAFSYYDVTTKQWHVAPGDYAVLVGLRRKRLNCAVTSPDGGIYYFVRGTLSESLMTTPSRIKCALSTMWGSSGITVMLRSFLASSGLKDKRNRILPWED